MRNCNIWGVYFLRKMDFVNIFMRKSGLLIFEIIIERFYIINFKVMLNPQILAKKSESLDLSSHDLDT